jgi:hypothetical protein
MIGRASFFIARYHSPMEGAVVANYNPRNCTRQLSSSAGDTPFTYTLDLDGWPCARRWDSPSASSWRSACRATASGRARRDCSTQSLHLFACVCGRRFCRAVRKRLCAFERRCAQLRLGVRSLLEPRLLVDCRRLDDCDLLTQGPSARCQGRSEAPHGERFDRGHPDRRGQARRVCGGRARPHSDARRRRAGDGIRQDLNGTKRNFEMMQGGRFGRWTGCGALPQSW